MESAIIKEIGRKLLSATRVLITSHIRPDGDAMGSVLGLGLALEARGKSVQMVLKDGVADIFTYLPGYEKIMRKPLGEFDCVVALDCSDRERLGGSLGERTVDINIDHHITNLYFAEANMVFPESAATSSILAEWLPKWGFVIDKPIAEALLSGIISDTIGFRTSNMTPNELRIAATLMELGADLPILYSQALMNHSFESVRYWGRGLEKLQRQDRLIWTVLTMNDRKDAHYPGTDDADLNNILSNIEDVDISVLFIEQKQGKIKVSWRAHNGFDVSGLALQLGGGGHPAASGVELSGTLEEVKEKVLSATQKLLDAGVQSSIKSNPAEGKKKEESGE
jgi:phosphoesterase RecJ-like protein